MKTKTHKKKSGSKRSSRRLHRRIPHTITVSRRGPFEFSCAIDDPRALLVEESLDERERRG